MITCRQNMIPLQSNCYSETMMCPVVHSKYVSETHESDRYCYYVRSRV